MKPNITGRQLTATAFFTVIASATAVLVGGNPITAEANSRSTACYKIPAGETPFASGGLEEPKKKEIWCFRQIDNPRGATLIYHVDEKGRSRPELSLMVNPDGTFTHASLNAGKLTVHRMMGGDFNPIGAPLEIPEGAERVEEPIAPTSADSPEEGIRIFQEHGHVPVDAAVVKVGDVSVTADTIPWRGYWWPYSTDRLHIGEDSPLAKYDKFIARRAAETNPGAQAWEQRHHNHGVSWSGHCNGWAAASVMAPEPTKPITDPFTGITFTIADQKGLLTERHYCPKIAFYGRRNYGRPDNDPRDIGAASFHNVITYFIGQLKKPVLVDLMPTVPVENSVISGYSMKTTRTGSNTYLVEMRAKVHLYDNKLTDDVGEARSITKVYKYVLNTNSDNRVISGAWISGNPDFLWVPLSSGECVDRNQTVDQFWLDEIARVSK